MKSVTIPVNEDYIIVVDEYNWQVKEMGINKKKDSKHFGERYELKRTFHHDLTGALHWIVKNTTSRSGGHKSVAAYLSWQESTIHSLADRVLRQRKQLSEALELNGVM